MTKRDVVIDALEFRSPAYVPWAWDMTIDCQLRCRDFLGKPGSAGSGDLSEFIASHFLDTGAAVGRWEQIDDDLETISKGRCQHQTLPAVLKNGGFSPLTTRFEIIT